MRLAPNSFAVILATGLALLAISATSPAQKMNALPPVAITLPEAPLPQAGLTEAEPATKQPVGEQNQQGSLKTSPDGPQSASGSIGGTVTDQYGDIIPGAAVILEGPLPADRREVVANDNAAFQFDELRADAAYHVRISVKGFVPWISPALTLAPGQHLLVSGVDLRLEGGEASVTVYASTEQIAVEQIRVAEQQRVLGFIPNFYVVYDSKNAVPLTTKLKFKLAMRVSVDPVTLAGVAFMAGIDQAANTPDYVQGAKGYGQRVGAIAADGFSDILIGGAILPSVLHQDPRYFYQGTGTTKSRIGHALFSPFICKGDNGRWQPNYSSLGGDLSSSAISNAYYPESNRGVGLVFGNFAIGTAERMASGFAQEFILRRLTPTSKKN